MDTHRIFLQDKKKKKTNYKLCNFYILYLNIKFFFSNILRGSVFVLEYKTPSKTLLSGRRGGRSRFDFHVVNHDNTRTLRRLVRLLLVFHFTQVLYLYTYICMNTVGMISLRPLPNNTDAFFFFAMPDEIGFKR